MPTATPSAALSLAICLALGWPQSARAADSDAHASQVLTLLSQWRIPEAQKALAPLSAIAPTLPTVQLAHASLLFHQGHYRRASKILGALARLPLGKNRTLMHLTALVSSTAATIKGYKSTRSKGGHFIIRYAPGRDAILVPYIAETLEAARGALLRELGHAPKEAIVVEVYPRPSDLARVSALTEADIKRTGTIALCKYNRLMIVSPGALARGYGWRDTLAHEYTHLVVSQLSHNTVPIWLHEGLAKHFETAWRLPAGQTPLTPAQKQLLVDALKRKRFIPWKKMHPSMAKLPDQRSTALAFAQVQTAIAYLLSKAPKGERTKKPARKLLLAMRGGATDFEAISRVTGLSKRAFFRAWRRHLTSLNLSMRKRVRWHDLEFKKRKGNEHEIVRIRRLKARRFFRLAELLRRRKLNAAAAIEYRKAYTLTEKRDPFISNALARTLLELRRAEQAARVLEPVVKLYPQLAGIQTTLGVALMRAGKHRNATEHLVAALGINPFAPEVHCSLAKTVSDKARAARFRKNCARLHRSRHLR
jgi:tetratricopeptide (TPR) repeat protein